MIEALRNPPARAEGRRAAHAEGRAPRVHRHPEPAAQRRGRAPRSAPARSSTACRRRKTTVVVRGRPNPQQAAGRDGGLKLMEIKRLREKGHRITLLERDAVLAARGQALRMTTRNGSADARSIARCWPGSCCCGDRSATLWKRSSISSACRRKSRILPTSRSGPESKAFISTI